MKTSEQKISQTFENQELRCGRMISYSKSLYVRNNPKGQPVFNANIVHKDLGKIWYGDLDLTIDSEKLQAIANELGELSVLREMDCRFDKEGLDYEQYKKYAVDTFSPENL